MVGYSFIMMFAAYFIVFLVFVGAVVAAVIIGVSIGKARAKKKEAENLQDEYGDYSVSENGDTIQIE